MQNCLMHRKHSGEDNQGLDRDPMAFIPLRTMTASNHRSFVEVKIGYYQESTRTTTSYNDQQLAGILKRVMAIYHA